MFIRTMHFKVDPGKISEFWAEADTVRAKLKVILPPNSNKLSEG